MKKNSPQSPHRGHSEREALDSPGAMSRIRGKTALGGASRRTWRKLFCAAVTLFLLPRGRGQNETTPEGPAGPAEEVSTLSLTDPRGLSHEL